MSEIKCVYVWLMKVFMHTVYLPFGQKLLTSCSLNTSAFLTSSPNAAGLNLVPKQEVTSLSVMFEWRNTLLLSFKYN